MRRVLAAVCVGVCVVTGLSAVVVPAGAAPARPVLGPVTAARVTTVGANTARIAWRNPTGAAARTHHGTQVRALRGGVAPRTIHQGRRVAGTSSARTAAIAAGLKPGTRYSFAVFATDGHGHVARPAVARATTLLHAPRYPRSYDAAHSTVVQWRNPAGMRRVVVRYAQGAAAPTSPRRGTGVTLPSARPDKVSITGLAAGASYAVSVFALDSAGRPSAPAVTRFTTPAKAPAGQQPGTYSGTVVDSTGAPLTNAYVAAYRFTADADDQTVSTTTGPDGTFALSLPPGDWFVAASGADAVGGNSDRTGYQYDTADASVAAGRVTTGGPFVLRPGAVVRGRVTDTKHRPIGDAQIYLGQIEPYVQVDTFGSFGVLYDLSGAPVTAADGTWTLRGVGSQTPSQPCAVGRDASVGGTRADFSTNCSGRAVAPAPGTSSVVPDLVLARGTGGTVAGTLRGFDGRPLSGVISIENEDDFGGFGQAAPDGTFRIGSVEPGTYRVCAGPGRASRAGSRTGYAATCSTSQVRVTDDRNTTVHVVEPRGAAVTGTVTGAGGRPLRGVDVTVEPARKTGGYGSGAVTDATGHFTVTGASAGRFTLCFEGTDTTNVTTGIAAGCWNKRRPLTLEAGRMRSGITIRPKPGAAVTGIVRDGDGKPVADVDITTESTRDVDDDDFADAMTGADGRYRLTGVSDGTYRICYSVFSLYSDQTQDGCRAGTVTARAARTVRGVDLVLPRPTAIAVTVRDTAGDPVAAVDATAVIPCAAPAGDESDEGCTTASVLGSSRKAGVVAASALTDGDGTTVLDGLSPGPHTVCLFAYHATTASGGSPTGYADACPGTGFQIVVKRDTITPVELTLADGGAVSGTVRDTDGKPVEHARLYVPRSAADDNPSAIQDGSENSEQDPFGDPYYEIQPGSPAAGSLTAADGTYTVIGVRPGATSVCARTNFTTARSGGYLPQCLGGAPGSTEGGSTVEVRAGADTGGVELTLGLGAELSGRVTVDDPEDSSVYVFTGRSLRTARFVQPDADGRWHLAGLPGTGYTACAALDEDGTVGSCWRGVTWDVDDDPPLTKATLITLPTGGSVTGIDFALK